MAAIPDGEICPEWRFFHGVFWQNKLALYEALISFAHFTQSYQQNEPPGGEDT